MDEKRYWAVVMAGSEDKAKALIDGQVMRGVRQTVLVCRAAEVSGVRFTRKTFWGLGFVNKEELMKFKMLAHPDLLDVYSNAHTCSRFRALHSELQGKRHEVIRHQAAMNDIDVSHGNGVFGGTLCFQFMVTAEHVEAMKKAFAASIDVLSQQVNAIEEQLGN